jgi:hypothetical protein
MWTSSVAGETDDRTQQAGQDLRGNTTEGGILSPWERPDECVCCSGFVRWVIKDEDRMRLLLSNPDKARQELWRLVKGGKA